MNTIFLDLPKSLAKLDTTVQGGSLISPTVRLIKEGKDDIHRFVIPFKLDNDEYQIDVSFHVRLRTGT